MLSGYNPQSSCILKRLRSYSGRQRANYVASRLPEKDADTGTRAYNRVGEPCSIALRERPILISDSVIILSMLLFSFLLAVAGVVGFVSDAGPVHFYCVA